MRNVVELENNNGLRTPQQLDAVTFSFSHNFHTRRE